MEKYISNLQCFKNNKEHYHTGIKHTFLLRYQEASREFYYEEKWQNSTSSNFRTQHNSENQIKARTRKELFGNYEVINFVMKSILVLMVTKAIFYK